VLNPANPKRAKIGIDRLIGKGEGGIIDPNIGAAQVARQR
jgi:hypothetical protein